MTDHNDKPEVAAPERSAADDREQASLDDVRNLIERLVPNADCRRLMLIRLADAILVAHGVGANRWAITLNKGRIRFNVGSYLAYEIGRGEAFLSLERSVLDELHLPELQQLSGWD